MKCKPWIRHFQPRKLQCFSSQFALHGLRALDYGSPTVNFTQPAPKYHTKGCSRSSVDSPGARTLVFEAFEPFSSHEFRASIARTRFCAILWRSPIKRTNRRQKTWTVSERPQPQGEKTNPKSKQGKEDPGCNPAAWQRAFLSLGRRQNREKKLRKKRIRPPRIPGWRLIFCYFPLFFWGGRILFVWPQKWFSARPPGLQISETARRQ